MKAGPKSSLRPFLHRALQFMIRLKFDIAIKALDRMFFVFLKTTITIRQWNFFNYFLHPIQLCA